MAITLVETVGAANANTYATLVECDSYWEARTFNTAWTDQSDSEKKKAALVQSAKLLDSLDYQGYRNTREQSLKWPRTDVYDNDGWLVDSETVPQQVKDAQCELAGALLKEDRTDDNFTPGLRSLSVGSISLVFNPNVVAKAVNSVAMQMLQNYVRSRLAVPLTRT